MAGNKHGSASLRVREAATAAPWTVPLEKNTQNVPFRFEPYVNLAVEESPEE
ncbi:hypothetical protein SAMN05216483_1938 [Streptomyces sp. 2131.1]|nr:hypothetical protein SAMN05216483_1938 [Streptomyces sp. 2131.1]